MENVECRVLYFDQSWLVVPSSIDGIEGLRRLYEHVAELAVALLVFIKTSCSIFCRFGLIVKQWSW